MGLLDELEADARQRSRSLEAAGLMRPGFTADNYPLTKSEQRRQRRLNAALLLADDVDTFCALAKGRPVARERLNPEQRRLLELRQG